MHHAHTHTCTHQQQRQQQRQQQQQQQQHLRQRQRQQQWSSNGSAATATAAAPAVAATTAAKKTAETARATTSHLPFTTPPPSPHPPPLSPSWVGARAADSFSTSSESSIPIVKTPRRQDVDPMLSVRRRCNLLAAESAKKLHARLHDPSTHSASGVKSYSSSFLTESFSLGHMVG